VEKLKRKDFRKPPPSGWVKTKSLLLPYRSCLILPSNAILFEILPTYFDYLKLLDFDYLKLLRNYEVMRSHLMRSHYLKLLRNFFFDNKKMEKKRSPMR
jgi:hypothetical protein